MFPLDTGTLVIAGAVAVCFAFALWVLVDHLRSHRRDRIRSLRHEAEYSNGSDVVGDHTWINPRRVAYPATASEDWQPEPGRWRGTARPPLEQAEPRSHERNAHR